MAQRWYCTYFDGAYAPRGTVMVSSLREVGDTSPVVVVCFDDEALAAVRKWKDAAVIAVPLADVEARYPALAATKASRTKAEYFFTSTPFVLLYALHHSSPGDWVTYLDADLWFAANPKPIHEEEQEGDVALVRHDYLPSHKSLERMGVFNVGWVSMRNSNDGLLAAHWWAQQCAQWCSDRVDGTRFADQGYLTEMASRFSGVVVITHPGANLAPWNINTRHIDMATNGQVMADGQPVLFVHFHGVRKTRAGYLIMHARYGTTPTRDVIDGLYRPYLRSLAEASAGHSQRPARRGRGWRGFAARTRLHLYDLRAALRGDVYRLEDPRLRPGRDSNDVAEVIEDPIVASHDGQSQ